MALNLGSRIAICKYCIEILEKETSDPRQPEALAYYKAQLAEMEAQKPAPIVIGLKTAVLTAKPQK